ncbi:protein-tyrosine phosphatase family protein [Pyrococcus abyssi]|uniref:protein-tyrosine-phosphatase n=1 Tax=Pyrococcus abyssi (strain GE5 / Orsay) TaxID=272844 RepID=Q9V1L1_PYRAB|nr:dual specificity protein phosphatase family protein [Pyrococcus abyssi]CAB49338.1 Protein tyrosine/serine/threonine phosphatase [Pyrococcus abyssi GE5]CCE69796.1 TPA: protein tyrosine phosphatase [Pyrococcus abyssi GE5]
MERFVDDNVAFGRMPYEDEVDYLLEKFNAFVVLVEDFELVYDLNKLRQRAEVLHSPIPDFTAPSLEQLMEIIEWIEEKVREGKKVYIHCYGGSGRSGTIATAWLMYSQGIPLREALRRVRLLKPSAVETEDQMKILEEFEEFLKKAGIIRS